MMRDYDIHEYPWPGNIPFYIQTARLNRDFPVHTHSFAEMVVILGGQGVHLIDASEYTLKTGDVFVISGRTSHGFRDCRDLSLCNIMFNDEILASTYQELKNLAGFQSLFVLEPFFRRQHDFRSRLVLDAEALSHVRRMIQLMQDEYDHHPEDQGIILKMHFLSLVASLSRYYSGTSGASGPLVNDLFYLAATVATIESHYTQPIRIVDLARQAHLSERHFTRIFTLNYQVPPIEYILRLRLQHARRLLANSDRSLTQIAADCGFYDLSAFSRMFKSRFALTPSEYRHRQGG
jgi:AraC-like DNA-binding protein